MSAISKPMAHSTTSTNGFAEIPVEQVVAVTSLIVPSIANFGPKYYLSFTLTDKTIVNIEYSTAAALSTAKSAYRSAFSTNF